MKKFFVFLLIAAMLFGTVACKPEPTIEAEDGTMTEEDGIALVGYLSSFGHVRVLGDIDHVLKGEKVDDEEGVVTQSMVAGIIAFNAEKTELAIPLTLTAYDFDGHRNPEDPTPWLYTRTATGKATLILTGKMDAAGTSFVASGYKVKDIDVTLKCADIEGYASLGLPETTVKADELTGIFVESDGFKLTNVTVTVADGKANGIADLTTPKFRQPSGSFLVNGREGELG